MKYDVQFSDEAISNIDRLYLSDRKLFHRIMKKIESLEESPREGKPLVGNHKGEFSLRIGNYRVVYMLDTNEHIISILTVRHRKHVY